MDEPELCQRDYDAADEVLRRNPVDGRIAEETRELLARLHAHFGRSKFRLIYGLRKPRGKYEEWRYQFSREQISKDALDEKIRQRAERPADQEMLDELFPQIESLLQHYGMGLSTAAQTMSSHCSLRQRKSLEDEASKHFLRTGREYTLDRRELITLSKFLDEVRFESGLGNASLGKFTASNAKDLTHLVFNRAIQHWQSCQEIAHRSQTQERYLYSTTAAKMLFGPNGPSLPTPQDLLTLLVEEWTAARVTLRKQARETESVAQKKSEPVIADATIQVQKAQINLDVESLQKAISKSKADNQEPLLKVEHWSELAVGIDDRRQFWAISPAPELGGQFRKSKAVRLPLSGKRWPKVLEAFAGSATGDCVTTWDFLRALERLPPGAHDLSDSRARPGAIEADITSDLGHREQSTRKTLNGDLKDLGSKFRKIIEGPVGKIEPCFRLDGDQVRCGFVVQVLIPNANGTSSFGKNPRSEGG